MVLERRLQGLTSLVVLDAASRAGFAPGIVAGLRPEAIWAVVPASWDERRARGLEAQLGRIDALVLYGLLATERPAGLIGRGWPRRLHRRLGGDPALDRGSSRRGGRGPGCSLAVSNAAGAGRREA